MENHYASDLSLLLVEDEQDIRWGMLNGIDWAAYGIGSVQEAPNGCRALEILHVSHVDIILTDVVMPLMDGIEFVKLARKDHSDAKVIFISGYQDMEYLKSAFKLNAIDYIFKPVDVDELDAILSRITHACRKEKYQELLLHKLSLQVESAKPVVKERFFRELLTGSYVDLNILRSQASYLGLPIETSSGYTVMAIKPVIDSETKRPLNETLAMLDIVLRDYGKEVLSAETVQLVLRDNLILISIHPAPLGYTKALEQASALFEKLSTHWPGRLTIGTSDSVRNLENLPGAYQQSLRAVEQGFFLGNGQPIHFSDVESQSGDTVYFSNTALEEVIDAVRRGRPSEVRLFLKHQFEMIRETVPRRAEIIRAICLELVFSTNRMLTNLRAYNEEGVPPTIEWDSLLDMTSFQKMHEWVQLKLSSAAEIVQSSRSNGTRLIVEQMKQKVNEQLAEDISTQSLGKEFKLTPNYVGMLFKKETGSTFLEYLTERRMHKAKKLLGDPRLKLYEIADAVGYTDPDYFTRVFKKTFGSVPSQYRDKLP